MQYSDLISQESKTAIDHWIAKYPVDQKRSAIVATLMILQEENDGYLTEDLMKAAADYLGLQPIEAYEIASFYDMYEFKFAGKHKIAVCTNVSCMLSGSEKIVDHLEKRLGVKMGESTPDGQFYLREVECMAACASAPMCQIDNKHYHENLTVEKMDAILDGLEKGEA
jgi:NADH-quinone oxidoreductase subunit E